MRIQGDVQATQFGPMAEQRALNTGRALGAHSISRE